MPALDGKIGEIRIGQRLLQAESALTERQGHPVAAREICKEVRETFGVPLSPSTYSLLRSDRRAPTVQQLVALSRVFDVTPEFLLGELGVEGRGGVQWARRMPALSPNRTRFVTALEHLLSGDPLSKEVCEAVGVDAGDLDDSDNRDRLEWELGRLAQSGVFLGVAELMVGDDALDTDLGARVVDKLRKDPALPESAKSRLKVTVVKNPVNKAYKFGGHMGPLITGRFGLEVIARFLKRHAHASQMGLAGGFHVASLVRQVGYGDLTWPERTYRLYPLGIEPFNKQISLADVLVGGLAYRLGALLGQERIQGYTLRAFGYLTDDGDVMLRQRSITTVLDQLTEIDIAVMGVGDSLTPDGPLQRVLATQGYKLASPDEAMADVCLNPINETGALLPLNKHNRVEQLIGVDTEQLRRMSQIEKNKLVLLLASGPRKARSARAIVRGGFVNHVLCDDVLARAILEL